MKFSYIFFFMFKKLDSLQTGGKSSNSRLQKGLDQLKGGILQFGRRMTMQMQSDRGQLDDDISEYASLSIARVNFYIDYEPIVLL